MTISLKIWNHPQSGEARIYVRGTPRDESKLWFGAGEAGKIKKHSVNIDGSAKYQGQTVYVKREKDIAVMADVLARFGMTGQTFEVLKAAVENNKLVEIEPAREVEDDE